MGYGFNLTWFACVRLIAKQIECTAMLSKFCTILPTPLRKTMSEPLIMVAKVVEEEFKSDSSVFQHTQIKTGGAFVVCFYDTQKLILTSSTCRLKKSYI